MEAFFQIYSFILGALIGSFLNVVIIRLPIKKTLVYEGSACPRCNKKLRWYHNIPIISFMVLRGKCAFCGAVISWRYPLIEILTGLIACWLMPTDINMESLGYAIFYFAIACVFICHFFIDLDHHLLLDSLNLYLLALILPFSLLTHGWTYWLTGGIVGLGSPLLVTWIFYKFRGQVGLGGGDIKLFGILGFFFGPMGIIFTIFLSCFVGALVGITMILSKKMGKENPMAFGPSILLVAAFQIFFPHFASLVQSWMFGMA